MGDLKFLIDTCTLLWWWSSPGELSPGVVSLIKDPRNTIFISAASMWEVATKTRIGKLAHGALILDQWIKRLEEDGFIEVSINSIHSRKAGLFPGEHRDPFDRMIAAQGLIEGMKVLTPDPGIRSFGADTYW
jgi:PIN domain nuclease of toxin-antitoxin system